MVDNEMGRFSHGFRALEFDRVKARDGEEAGFDIKRGEIMEESQVSVPANIDAQTEEVLLSLVEGGKLTSPIMKQVGRGIRDHRPVSVPVQLNLKVMLNGQEVKCEDEPGSRKEEEKADGVTPPEETHEGDEVQVEKAKDDKVEDQEKPVEGVDVCPKCGSENINDGVCGDCGAKVEAEEEPEEEKASDKVCAECGGDIGEDGACKECGAKPGKEEEKPEDEKGPNKPTCPECGGDSITDGICDDCGEDVGTTEEDDEEEEKSIDVDHAMAVVLAHASREQRNKMVGLLQSLQEIDKRTDKVKQYLSIVGRS
jgi:ribosomal protein L32